MGWDGLRRFEHVCLWGVPLSLEIFYLALSVVEGRLFF